MDAGRRPLFNCKHTHRSVGHDARGEGVIESAGAGGRRLECGAMSFRGDLVTPTFNKTQILNCLNAGFHNLCSTAFQSCVTPKTDTRNNNGEITRDISFFISFLSSCQNLASTLPTMQPK